MLNKQYLWDEEKNQLLQLQRGLSFELVLQELEAGRLLAKLKQPNIPINKYM